MKLYHSHKDYSRAWDLKHHVEMAFRESKSAEGLMKYLKWLGIESVVTGNTVKFIDHKDMAVINARALPSYVRDRILNASAKVQTHITFPAIARPGMGCPPGGWVDGVDTVDSGGRPRVWCEDAVPGMGLQQSLFAGF